MKLKLLTFSILLFCLKIQGQQNTIDLVQVKIIGDTLVDAEGKTVLINDPKRKNGLILKMFSLDNQLKEICNFITNEKQIEINRLLELIDNGKLILDGDYIIYKGNDTIKAHYTNGKKIEKKEQSEGVVYTYVKNLPEYPGGIDSMLDFIKKNTVYPREAWKKGISGRVYVQFVVDIDGSLESLKIVRGVHPLLDAEAVRVISTMPLWKPGEQNGKKVKVQMSIPINFRLR